MIKTVADILAAHCLARGRQKAARQAVRALISLVILGVNWSGINR